MKEPDPRAAILGAPYLNAAGLSRDIGKLLVLAPHPDDESLACGGLIALLGDSGTDVHIIFVTSGGASHPGSKSHPPKKLARLREREALRACARLGVARGNVSFLRKGDSELARLSDRTRNELSFGIIQKFNKGKISSLALPWRRDPHADHRAVYDIGKRALRFLDPEMTVIEYPVWLWKNGKEADWPAPGEIVPYRLDIGPVAARKRTAIGEHLSQLGKIITDDPEGFVLTGHLLEPFTSDTEYFFLTDPRKPKNLDGGYFDTLYRENGDPWNFRESEYEHGKYKLSVAALGKSKFEKGLEIGCSIGIHTREIAKRCERLLAVDVSPIAIKEAKRTCTDLNNVRFRISDVTEKFPQGKFDLISLCEVGYYFEEETLLNLFGSIRKGLQKGGKFLMVHWTPYVPGYPLTGDRVHTLFEEFVLEHGDFGEAVHERHELFRLQVWERETGPVSK